MLATGPPSFGRFIIMANVSRVPFSVKGTRETFPAVIDGQKGVPAAWKGRLVLIPGFGVPRQTSQALHARVAQQSHSIARSGSGRLFDPKFLSRRVDKGDR